jgi:hypothetical protein
VRSTTTRTLLRCIAITIALLVWLLAPGPAGAQSDAGNPRPSLSIAAPDVWGRDWRSVAVRSGVPFELVFYAENSGSEARGGSITVSFPSEADDPDVAVVDQSDLPSGPDSYAKVFEPYDEMYHFGLNRNVPIRHRTVELYATPWPAGERYWVRVRITARSPFTVQARATLRGVRFFMDPPAGRFDDQGGPTVSWDFTPT